MFPRLSRFHAVAALGAGAAAKVSTMSAPTPTLAMQPGDWVPLVNEKAFFNYGCRHPQTQYSPEIKMKMHLPQRKFVPCLWYNRARVGLSMMGMSARSAPCTQNRKNAYTLEAGSISPP